MIVTLDSVFQDSRALEANQKRGERYILPFGYLKFKSGRISEVCLIPQFTLY